MALQLNHEAEEIHQQTTSKCSELSQDTLRDDGISVVTLKYSQLSPAIREYIEKNNLR